MEMEMQMEMETYINKIDEYLRYYADNNQWSGDISLTYVEDLIFIRSKMREKVELLPLPYLTYKKVLWHLLKEDYSFDIEINDEILLNNRLPDGQKLTKKMSNEIAKQRKDYYYQNDTRLDYFNKVRNEKNTYILSADPLDILELYNEDDCPRTCLSAGASNQSTMYRYLFSDQVYIAFTSDKRSRMIIFENSEEKVVYFNPVYGDRDFMLPEVMVNYYMEHGYRFLEDATDFFSFNGWYYEDGPFAEYIPIVDAMGGEIITELFKKRVPINRIPAHWDKTYEALTRRELENTIIYQEFKDSGDTTVYDGIIWCDNCGEFVYEDEYNYDVDCCNYCADNYYREEGTDCKRCGIWTHYNELNEEGYCENCVDKINRYVCDACGEIIEEGAFEREGFICEKCDKEGKNLEEIVITLKEEK